MVGYTTSQQSVKDVQNPTQPEQPGALFSLLTWKPGWHPGRPNFQTRQLGKSLELVFTQDIPEGCPNPEIEYKPWTNKGWKMSFLLGSSPSLGPMLNFRGVSPNTSAGFSPRKQKRALQVGAVVRKILRNPPVCGFHPVMSSQTLEVSKLNWGCALILVCFFWI